MVYFSLKLFILVLVSVCFANGGDDRCPKIKTRSKWDGKSASSIDYQTIPVQYVIIHHTVSQKCNTFSTCAAQVRNIQHYHQDIKGWPDIGYNFLVGNDGNVYEGVGWNRVGTHTAGYNNKSIGIAFIGNFSDELPSPGAIQAAQNLMYCGTCTGELSKNYRMLGARQLKSTESPGLSLYSEIQDWTNWVSSP